jgi:hypothetical protein
MAQTIPHPESAVPVPDLRSSATAHLDCERLDCYRVAVEFQAIAARLLANRRPLGALRDQLDRASVSIVLNLAEGAGRRTPRDKAHFFTNRSRQLDGMRRHPGSAARPRPVGAVGSPPRARTARSRRPDAHEPHRAGFIDH